ncbi:putative ribonuclease H-like domain-containing protein [Tanacetum coccineum]
MKKSYCLVVTNDFSRFSWVFFLATKDETSGILKTFITEIENQLDYKVKVIRSDNGTEFKNSVMNQFCEMKGIKREFSVSRTPQQNGVAERKNRTLIKAVRTMLVDSKLPTTFWAEAVNTACYVLNRVLVIKPHNKTPYELIHGRTPLIDFMKPFGCPVTILNTRDNLGKFDGKDDEGFFVGYSVVSKAIRVFNKRIRIVKETLHIRFLENAPNVTGNEPNWLFDVDSLTISMNYVPVVVGNQTNGIAGTRDNIVASQFENKIEPKQEYILIAICTTDPLISQGPKDSEEDTGVKPSELDESEALDKDRKDDQDTLINLLRSKISEEETCTYYSFNTIGTLVSVAGPSFTNDDPSSPVNAAEASNAFEEHLFERFSPFKNAFTLPPVSNVTPMDDTVIFGNACDDEDVGAEADLNNLETTMNVSPIPTTRVDKDHPKDQIIRDLNSAIQTRRMTKISNEHAMVSYINKQRPDIMYLTASRPDIMFAVCACAMFQVTPKMSHLHAVKRIFRYLKGQPKLGLWYPRDSPFDLEAFSDSDYARASLDRKSTTGGCQFLGKRLISWQCKKQTIIAKFTTKEEYVAAANCYRQVIWIQNQMLDYGFNFMNTKIYIDNESTICIVKNPMFHSKTKHILIRHHFIRDSYEKRLIQVIKIHTDHNVADLVIKAFDVSSTQQMVINSPCLIDKKELAIPGQTTTSKEFSNLLIAVNSVKQIHAIVDGKAVVISESSVMNDLLFDDEDGITCLTNDDIFENLKLMGNLDSKNFLMYPRFLKLFLNNQLKDLPEPFNDTYDTPSHTKKVFSNMARQSKGFSGKVTPIFNSMLVQNQTPEGEGSAIPPEPQPTPSILQPNVSEPQTTPLQTETHPIVSHEPQTEAHIEQIHPSPSTYHKTQKDSGNGYSVLNLEKEKDATKAVSPQLNQRGKTSDKTKPMFKDNDFDDLDDLVDEESAFVQDKDAENQGDSTAGEELLLCTPKTPLTIITVFNDEDVTMAMAQTLIKMKEEKAKAKVVAIKDVEDSSRPIRSITTLQPLLTIDPKDKGKVVLAEEEPKKLEKLAELDRAQKEKQKQEDTTNAALAEEFDEIQARMDADHELAVILTHEEQEKYIIEERATLLAKYFEKRKKKLATERVEAIRNKPPTRAQRIADSTSKQKLPKKSKVIKEQESAESNTKAAADYEQKKEELRTWLAVVLDEDETVDPELLFVKYPIVDWESQNLGSADMEDIHVYKIIRADGNTSYHKTFSSMLRKFDRQDLIDLHKLVMKRFEDNTPEGYNFSLIADEWYFNMLQHVSREKICFHQGNVEENVELEAISSS